MQHRKQFVLTDENATWIEEMKSKGISESALVNLAIDILKPRLDNLGATESSIVKTLYSNIIEENLPY